MALAEVSDHFDATPGQVWSVLSDGKRYREWVRGTKEIRAVDPGWPEPGTALHYSAGLGPITHDDKTTVLSSRPPSFLELEAHAWPAGTARIAIRIEPAGAGCQVTLHEHPLRGLARLLHNPLTSLGLAARGKVMLKDLRKLAEAEPAA
jgi:polyketide cyclase/dehydrase/lipid transport protein